MKLRAYGDAERLTAEPAGGFALTVMGPELCQARWLMERTVAAFRRRGFDTLRFDAPSLQEGDVRRHLTEGSFLSPGRLVVVSLVHALGKKPASELLDAAGSDIGDSAALFLHSTKVPRESAILKKLEQLTPSFICYEPFERDVATWAGRIAGEEGIRLGPGVVALLCEYSGRCLYRLGDAVRRLAVYHGADAVVDASGLRKVLYGSAGTDSFHLGDMLFGGRRGDALRAARMLLRDGEEPLAMLGYLFGHWQKVVTAREVVASGGDQNAVAAATGTGFPVTGKLMGFVRAAGSTPGPHPADAAAAFESADRGLKSGEDPLVAFGRLIFALTRSGS